MAPSQIEVGQEVGPFTIDRVLTDRMKTVAALLRDPNPIHFDVEAVRSLGMGDKLINQGPLGATYMLELVTRFAGGPEHVRECEVRYLGNVVADDRVVCSGKVTAVDAEAGTASLDLTAEADGTPVLGGTAVVALKS